MRVAVTSILVLLYTLGGCSTTSSSTAPGSAGDAEALQGAEDGNASGCASLGGTCIPFSQPCPVLQQNSALCENTILVCCLPPGGPRLPMPDSGAGEPDSSRADAAAPAEAGTVVDAARPLDAARAMDATADATPSVDAAGANEAGAGSDSGAIPVDGASE